jgi:hypothetical protein
MEFMVDVELIWSRIQENTGQKFYQITGNGFTYFVEGDYLIPDRTKVKIPKKHFEEALKYVPLSDTIPLQNLRGPSYIFAILTDKRIRNLDYGL